MNVAERRSVRFRPDSLLAVASLAGLAVPFLPFTYSTSPWDAIHDRFWMLAAPFFLAFFVSAAPIRRLISGAPPPAERWIAYAIAAAMTCPTIAVYVEVLSEVERLGTEDWLILPPIITLLIVAGLVIRNARLGKRTEASAVNALQAAYLSNAVLTLFNSGFDWQLGAYLAALTALVYAADIIVSSTSRSAPSQAG
jgi:hypothetical protein